MAETYSYIAQLDDSQILAALTKIEKGLGGLGDNLESALSSLEKELQGSLKSINQNLKKALDTKKVDNFGQSLQQAVDINTSNLEDGLSRTQQIIAQLKQDLESGLVDMSNFPFEFNEQLERFRLAQAVPGMGQPIVGSAQVAEAYEGYRPENIVDTRFLDIYAEKLQAATRDDPLTQQILNQARAAGASKDEITDLVVETSKLSQADIELFQAEAQATRGIEALIAGLDRSSASYNEQIQRIGALKQQLNAIQQQRLRNLDIDRRIREGQTVNEQHLKNLFAQQLQAAAGADDLTKKFIEQTRVNTTNVDTFRDLVSELGNLTPEQINYAEGIARTNEAIERLTRSLAAGEGGYESQREEIINLQKGLEKLRAEEDAAASSAERRAALLQQAADIAEAATQVEVQAAKKRAAAQEESRKTLIKNIRANKNVSSSVEDLINKYGELRVRFTDDNLSRPEKEFRKIINSSKELRNVWDQLKKSTPNLDTRLNMGDLPKKIGSAADQSEKLEKNLKGVGKQAGITAAITFALVNAFERLISRVVEFGKQAIGTSSEVATKFELLEKSLENTLDTTEGGAAAALDEIRKISEEVGQDVSGLASAFIPLVGSWEELKSLSVVAAGLKELSTVTGKTATNAEIVRSIAEAQSGDLRSARQIFELTNQETDKIVEQYRSQGGAGLIAGFEEVLEERGIDLEAIFNSLPNQLGQLEEKFRSFAGAIGAPLNEIFANEDGTGAINRLNKFLEENREKFLDVADAIGFVIANVAEFLSTELIEYIENIDFDEIVNDILQFQNSLITIKSALDGFSFFEFVRGFEEPLKPASLFVAVLEKINSIILAIPRAIAKGIDRVFGTSLEQVFVDVDEGFERIRTRVDEINEKFGSLQQVILTLRKVWVIVLKVMSTALAGFLSAILLPINLFINELNKAIEFANATFQTNFEKIQPFDISNINEATDAFFNVEGAAQATLDAIEANKEATEANTEAFNEYVDATSNAELPGFPDRDYELSDTEREVLQDRLELELEYIDQTLDLEEKLVEERIDLEVKYQDKLADIRRGFTDDLFDLYRDFGRDRADLEEEFAEEIEDAEQESANKRAEIEREYLRKLQDLREQFQFDAQEAIRANDAIAFLRLRRKLAFDRRQAKIERDRELEDLAITERLKAEEREKARQRERDELKKDLQRDLQDLLINLQRQRRDARTERQRQLRDLETDQKRQEEELQKSYERQLRDFNIAKEERLGSYDDMISRLLEEIETGNQSITNRESDFYELRLDNYQSFIDGFEAKTQYFSQLQEQALSVGGRLRERIEGIGEAISEIVVTPEERLRAAKQVAIRIVGEQGFGSLASAISNSSSLDDIVDLLRGSLPNPAPFLQKVIAAYRNATGRRFGGPVQKGRPYIVGEAGPELFMSGFSGKIVPLTNPANFTVPIPTGGSSANTYNNFQNNFSMMDLSTLSPQQRAAVQQMIVNIMLQVTQNI